MPWTTVLAEASINAGAIIAAAAVSVRVSAAILKTRIDGHDQRLAHHDEMHKEHFARFNQLNIEFVPREAINLQFQALQDSNKRIEGHMQYLVFKRSPGQADEEPIP